MVRIVRLNSRSLLTMVPMTFLMRSMSVDSRAGISGFLASMSVGLHRHRSGIMAPLLTVSSAHARFTACASRKVVWLSCCFACLMSAW